MARSIPWRLVFRWTLWSLLFGPAVGVVLAIVLIQVAAPTDALDLPRVVLLALLFWGAGAGLLALLVSPIVFLVYAAWALACRIAPGLDRRIVVIAPAVVVLPASWLGFWFERMDAADVGRAFSQAGAIGASFWLATTVSLGILLPRYHVHDLRPGAFGHAARLRRAAPS